MSLRFLPALLRGILLLVLLARGADAAERQALKALVISGGCCHDYKKLLPHLATNISALVKVTFEVKYDLEILNDEKFAEPFDVLIFDQCQEEGTATQVRNALVAVRAGKPAVVVHCALHAFKSSSEWRDCCGMTSKVHDPFQAFGTEKLDSNHPITKSFPEDWKTAGDELYQTIKMGQNSHPLLKVKSPHSGQEHIVCWTNTYGKARVFGTTLGHDMKTASDPRYHRLLANGLLWACDKLDAQGQAAAGYAAPPPTEK